MDQLSNVLTHVNVNLVINFIYDLWQERKINYIVNLYVLHCYSYSLFLSQNLFALSVTVYFKLLLSPYRAGYYFHNYF